MRRFRRRKPRVVWLPVHGRAFTTDPELEDYGNGFGGLLTVLSTGGLTDAIAACTFDYSDSASSEEGPEFRSLQDLTSGNNYRLRRLVGKVFAGVTIETESSTVWPTVDVAAGFIINRTDDDGNVLNVSNEAGPLHMDAAQDPWIWRRRWLLSAWPRGTGESASTIQAQFGQGQPIWPQTTADYGSVQDGPHLDQKTARVISNQERLIFWIQCRAANPQTGLGNGLLNWGVDLRILASLRSQIGNRRNASR